MVKGLFPDEKFPEIPPQMEHVRVERKSDEPPDRVKKIVDQMMELNLRELMAMTKLLQQRLGLSDAAFQSLLLGSSQVQAVPIGAVPFQMGAAVQPQQQQHQQQQQQQQQQATKEEPKPSEARPVAGKYDIKLIKYPDGEKFKVLKEIRTLKPGMPLMESKALVENLPQIIAKGLSIKEAEEWKTALAKVGAVVELV